MAGTPKRIAGPAYIVATSEDIYTPSASTIYTVITHIHVTNDDVSARTFSLYIGATGAETAGTALVEDYSLLAAGTAGASWDYYGQLRMNSTDFLVGIASDATSCVITVEGYQVVV
jgi:hypothetical protein